jgi:ABC-2 type transport system ATP-binding protein
MSGLDPIGREEVRDLIASLRDEGKTVLFSTHILSDAELLCDRAAIVVGGTMRGAGPLDTLLSPKLLRTEIVVEGDGGKEVLRIAPDVDVNGELGKLLAAGKRIVSVTPRRESLEDLFVREVESGDTGMGAGHAPREVAS